MIFNSPQLQKLREKYVDVPLFRAPGIIVLDRREDLVKERAYLEFLITSIPPIKQKEWLGRLLDTDWKQYLGVWFEMMLYGWLKGFTIVDVEPEIEGHKPDFAVQLDDKKIILEAVSCLISDEEREKESWRDAILWTIDQIRLPYVVSIEHMKLQKLPDIDQIEHQVSAWLKSSPDTKFEFTDKRGNYILCIAEYVENFKTVGVFGPSKGEWINPDLLKPSLKRKARQHKQIRQAGYPYVICIYIEHPSFEAEEVAQAWFGKETWIVDTHKMEVVDTRIDLSGLHFWHQDVRHRSVSGTLIFRKQWDPSSQARSLDAWYVENPYAINPLSPDIFPVKAVYQVVERTPKGYTMGWKKKQTGNLSGGAPMFP